MDTSKLVYLDLATLTAMQTQWNAALAAIATGNQSYSIAGRTFTRANLSEVAEMVGGIAYAIKLKGGQIISTVVADMGC